MFGGHYKSTEFMSVFMDNDGNVLAGGYSQDETLFMNKGIDTYDTETTSTTVPILAYYPAYDTENFKMFQIYLWPSVLPIT